MNRRGPVNCRLYEERLDALLDGTLDAGARRAAEAHAATCRSCRELTVMLRGHLQVLPADAPSDLAEGILARTTGSACARAEEQICDRTDGLLPPVDAQLLGRHLERCDTCAALSAALPELIRDLGGLLHATPDERFVRDVLSSTLPLRQRLARRLGAVGRRWREALARPRFAWEGAFIGALILGLLVGPKASPLHGVGQQALALAQTNPVEMISRSPVGQAANSAGAWTRRTWNAAGVQVQAGRENARRAIAGRWQRVASASKDLRGHVAGLGRSLLRLDLGTSFDNLRAIGTDLRRLVVRLLEREDDRDHADDGDNRKSEQQP